MNNFNNAECKSCSKEPVSRINVQRFISALDGCFLTNDLEKAKNVIEFWKNEAKNLNDDRGLLSIINEELGFCRRTGDENGATEAVKQALRLIKELGLENNFSAADIFVNAATTLKCFKRPAEALDLYKKAEKLFEERAVRDFDYSAFLNNYATALCDLGNFDEGEIRYNQAIDLLKEIGGHDGEIAVTLINLAHLIFDRDDTAYEQTEKTLDLAWEYINSPNLIHDANYAFILSKCAPSLRYFAREELAIACEQTAEEIYSANKTDKGALSGENIK